MWGMRKCGFGQRGVAFGLWCAVAPDNYVTLGCVWRRTDCGDRRGQADTDPPKGAEVSGFVTLHRDYALPGSSSYIWSDEGSGVLQVLFRHSRHQTLGLIVRILQEYSI